MDKNTVPLNIVLHDKQKLIEQSQARYKVIKAGKRFGKTKWALYSLLRKAGLKDNGVFWYLAPTYKQAKRIAWNELNWMLPKVYVKRSSENELFKDLINGTRIQLIGCDEEDALRGPKIDGAVFDECAYIDEYVWPGIVRGQLVGSGGQQGGFAYFISSPNRRGRNWFTNFHAEAERRMKSGDKDWAAWYFTIHDNPTLNEKEVEDLKNDNSEDTWKTEYLAQESDFSGILYNEFSYSDNIETCEHLKERIFVGCLDWGMEHPTVYLFLSVDVQNKTVYVVDEYFKSGATIEEHCNAIKARIGNRKIDRSICDPQLNKRNSQTGRSDMTEFSRYGVPLIPGDNRFRGYDIVKNFLKKRLLKVHPKCKNLINQLKTYQRGEKEGDDCLDALRYGIVDIHDKEFGGMNIWPSEKSEPVSKKDDVGRNTYNLRDDRLFPEVQKVTDFSWAYE